jgi:peptidoglycan/LPS O-acetylase OafA/YrhL
VRRLDGIDTLRGLSILAVLLLHISLRMRFAGHSFESDWPSWLYHLLFWNGNNGVTVFFAVSGFLITLTSAHRFGSLESLSPWRFYWIRFARLAPLLLLVLGVLSALHWLGVDGYVIPADKGGLGRALVAALTFHVNWLEAEVGYLPASWDVLWSLSVEEVFYLGFPLLCLLRLRWLLFGFLLAGPFARTVWTTNEIWREKSYLGGMDAIAMGCLAAMLASRLIEKKAAVGWLVDACGWGMIFLIACWPPWEAVRWLGRTGLDGSILALGTCLVMVASVVRGRDGFLWTAPLRWLGRLSYEIYLTHEFVVIAAASWYASGSLYPWFAATVAVSALVGAIVARYFSEPLNRKLRAIA